MMKLIFAAFLLAMVAWWIAGALGIPRWRDWGPGDQWDIATAVFVAVILLGSRP